LLIGFMLDSTILSPALKTLQLRDGFVRIAQRCSIAPELWSVDSTPRGVRVQRVAPKPIAAAMIAAQPGQGSARHRRR